MVLDTRSISCERTTVTATSRPGRRCYKHGSRGGGAARWRDPWPETGIGADLTRFATHDRAGQSSDRRGFWTAMVMVMVSASGDVRRATCFGLVAGTAGGCCQLALCLVPHTYLHGQCIILLTSMVYSNNRHVNSFIDQSLLVYSSWTSGSNTSPPVSRQLNEGGDAAP